MPAKFPNIKCLTPGLTWAGGVLCALLLFTPCLLQAQTNNLPFRIGFSSSLFTEVNLNDVKAAVKAWAHAVALESGCPIETDPIIFRTSDDVVNALRQKTCDAFALSFPEYWGLHQDLSFDPIFTTIPQNKTNVEYLLLARQKPSGLDIKNLRDSNLLFYQSPKTALAMPWLDLYLHQHGMQPASSFFKRITSVTKPTAAVLPVFFGKHDACLVDRLSFETMVELNPQISQELKTWAVSPGYIPGLFCFRSDYDGPYKQNAIDALTNLHTSPAGRQVLLIFHLEKTVPLHKSQLASSAELLSLHQQITNGLSTVLANAKPLGPSGADSPKAPGTNAPKLNIKPILPHE